MLLHVVARPTAAGLAFAVREFYVGHSYDTLQQAGLVRDAGGRTTMLLVNITTTPRVAGVLAPLARPIAERFLAQALAAYFASLRDRAAAQPG
jgi:hypothetical protein